MPCARRVLFLAFLPALLLSWNADAGAVDPSPDWYRRGETPFETFLESRVSLIQRTLHDWSEQGFAPSESGPWPRFVTMTLLPNHERPAEIYHDLTIDVAEDASTLYIGTIGSFYADMINRECKLYAVDGSGEGTLLFDFSSAPPRRTSLGVSRTRIAEIEVSPPTGTKQLLFKQLYVLEPSHRLLWIDRESRYAMIESARQPLGELWRRIERDFPDDTEPLRALREEIADRDFRGFWTDYDHLLTAYKNRLPDALAESIEPCSPRGAADVLAVRELRKRYEHVNEAFDAMRIDQKVDHVRKVIADSEDGSYTAMRARVDSLDRLVTRYRELHDIHRRGRLDIFSELIALQKEWTVAERIFELETTLALAERTAEYVGKSAALDASYSQSLNDLSAEIARVTAEASPAVESIDELNGRIAALRREILFQHPDLQFEKLLLCVNPQPGPGHMCDQYLGRHAREGVGIVVVDGWRSDCPVETLITEGMPSGQFHHMDLSYDAKRVVFGFCELLPRNRNEQRHWIYEAEIDGHGVRQLTGTPDDPLERVDGRETVILEDWDPCYLPDGGIAFMSTRCQSYGRCHGGRYVPAFMLCRMDGDGGDLRRLSFGEANEWDPAVLPDGRIVYTRWDYINRHDVRFQGLWTTHPDGTKTAHFHGSYSPVPCMTADTQPIPGTNRVVSTATAHHGYTNGSIIIVDPTVAEDGLEALTRVTPEIPFPEAEGTAAWQTNARAMAPYPINDTLFLCAYSEHGTGGPYHIYLVDTLGGRELVYDRVPCAAAIPVRPREVPALLPSQLPESVAEDTPGTLFIQDIYQNRHVSEEHPIEHGSIRSLRVNLILTQPTRNKWERSAVSNEIIKRPLGTVPVTPSGAAAFEAPSGVPLQLQALDENGMAVMTMRSFIYLHAGESQTCIGCHEQRTSTPVRGVMSSRMPGIATLKPTPGVAYDDEAFSFTRTVQPVLDRYCVECHGLGGKTDDGRDAPGSYVFRMDHPSSDFNRMPGSYTDLIRQARPRLAHRNSETFTSVPRDYFSHACRMPAMLLEGHHGVELPEEDFAKIITWLDLNCQCYGTYGCNRMEQRPVNADAERQLRDLVRERFGDAMAAQPIGALVNPAELAQSRVLMAPLPGNEGGWGQVAGGYRSTDDPAYRQMYEAASNVYEPLEYVDIAGTCGRGSRNGCVCGNCWIREIVEQGGDYIHPVQAE